MNMGFPLSETGITLGFLGAGRMATALARGCVHSGFLPAERIVAADPQEAARHRFGQEIPNCRVVGDNAEVLDAANVAILAVKPQVMGEVLADCAGRVTNDHLMVSIAAGVPLKKLADAFPAGTRLVRVMPNTPCLIGMGASCFSRGAHATDSDARLVESILTRVGKAFEVPETQLDAVTGLSGSGPAFLYSVIEALAAGGEAMGLPPELALSLAAQTTRGAGEMVLATGLSPGELRDQVTSPGGTTLAGLEVLEASHAAEGFRAAVERATQRSIELGEA